jgi:lipopolysaccharide export system ATP-binding protein
MLAEFGLMNLAGRKAGALSGVEGRKLEICRALLLEPKLLMLDEPLSGIDPIGWAELVSLIRGLPSRGVSVLLTDHNAAAALRFCDRAYVMIAGRVLAGGTASELLNFGGRGA